MDRYEYTFVILDRVPCSFQYLPTDSENSIFCEHFMQFCVMKLTSFDANQLGRNVRPFVSRVFFLFLAVTNFYAFCFSIYFAIV